MLKRINIMFIDINYKRITMIIIHFNKKRSLAKNAFNIKHVKQRAICLIQYTSRIKNTCVYYM